MSSNPSIDLVPHGDRTVAKICGEKWPRLMSVRIASAYAGLPSAERFRAVPAFAALIRRPLGNDGNEMVDRTELDETIGKLMMQK